MSTASKMKDMLAKPLVIGVISALGSKALGIDIDVGIPLLGDVNSVIFFGLLGAGSSVATETLHQWVLPYLPQSSEMVKIENALLSPALHAAVNVGVLYFIYPAMLKTYGYTNPILLGIGSEIAGSYAYDNFVRAMLQ